MKYLLILIIFTTNSSSIIEKTTTISPQDEQLELELDLEGQSAIFNLCNEYESIINQVVNEPMAEEFSSDSDSEYGKNVLEDLEILINELKSKDKDAEMNKPENPKISNINLPISTLDKSLTDVDSSFKRQTSKTGSPISESNQPQKTIDIKSVVSEKKDLESSYKSQEKKESILQPTVSILESTKTEKETKTLSDIIFLDTTTITDPIITLKTNTCDDEDIQNLIKKNIELSQLQIDLLNTENVDLIKLKKITECLNSSLKLQLESYQKINETTTLHTQSETLDKSKSTLKLQSYRSSQQETQTFLNTTAQSKISSSTSKSYLRRKRSCQSFPFASLTDVSIKHSTSVIQKPVTRQSISINKTSKNTLATSNIDTDTKNSVYEIHSTPLYKKRKLRATRNTQSTIIIKDQNPKISTNIPIEVGESSKSTTSLYINPSVAIKKKYSDVIITNEEDEDDYKTFIKEYPNPVKTSLHNLKKLVFHHKSANDTALYTKKYDFLKYKWTTLYNSEQDITEFPKGFSFVPGWHNYKIHSKYMLYSTIKHPAFVEILEEYGLINYGSLIYNMITINTFNKNNSKIPEMIVVHIICFHLCTTYNLGKGKDIKVDQTNSFHYLINNANFNKLFKPKKYWQQKAKLLLKNAKKQALNELLITESSFNHIHLYNILHLMSSKCPSRVAFVFYVFHASNKSELDCNLDPFQKDYRSYLEKIKKRKKLYKINQERCYCVKNARYFFKVREKKK
ncbi:hypothetical protein NUSPORA_01868 [Nucleospora cyclopteri]